MDMTHGDDIGGTDMTGHPGLSRKNLLRGAGAGAGALILGGAVGAAPAAARGAATSARLGRRTYRAGYGGATCEAFTYAAYNKGFFAQEGLHVKLDKGILGAGQPENLEAGVWDIAPSNFYSWLKPIEQGADLVVTAGIHEGCLRMVVGVNTGIKTYADLKGKTIGTNGPTNDPFPLFAIALARAGVDPIKDVQWRGYTNVHAFGPALDKGEIQAVAGIDPTAYVLVEQGKAVEIGSNMTGMFAGRFCCAVALRGSLVREDPQAAAALTRALMNGSRYTGGHIHEVATIEVQHKYVTVDEPTAEHLLSSYTWKPSASLIKEQLVQGARDLKLIGFLDKKTDPVALANKAYVDVFKLAAQAT
jgi:NitT/TauT family transport system substrate-binding protein